MSTEVAADAASVSF